MTDARLNEHAGDGGYHRHTRITYFELGVIVAGLFLVVDGLWDLWRGCGVMCWRIFDLKSEEAKSLWGVI